MLPRTNSSTLQEKIDSVNLKLADVCKEIQSGGFQVYVLLMPASKDDNVLCNIFEVYLKMTWNVIQFSLIDEDDASNIKLIIDIYHLHATHKIF